eukprot:GHRQ01015194.1.p2 GENE.GHRQ01015194.1~~GHRQ01015194.1.p2  ORF type:complete len:126 (-),score=37.63 GHRQ01015194.1:27-404(-)
MLRLNSHRCSLLPCPARLPQSLVRIPETLMCAMEFITLYTPPEHSAPLEELRKVVAPFYGDLMARTNKTFWQRKVRPAARGRLRRGGSAACTNGVLLVCNQGVPDRLACCLRARFGRTCLVEQHA